MKKRDYASPDLEKGPDIPELERWIPDMEQHYRILALAPATVGVFHAILRDIEGKHHTQE
jgi:hypothetical protein